MLDSSEVNAMNGKKPSWLALIAAGLWLALGLPASGAPAKLLHGHVPAAVRREQPRGRVPVAKRLDLAIGLPLRNAAGLTNLLQELYEPGSPRFRNYLAPEQFTEQFGPTEDDYQAVIAFAEANGLRVTGRHPNRMLLNVSGAASDVERAFNIVLNLYRHPTEAREFYAPETEPSVDASLPILDISGLSDYGRPHAMSHKADALAVQPNGGGSAGGAFIGNDFRAAYVPGTWLTGSNQVVGLLQFDGFYASDITSYEAQAGLPNVPLQTVLLDGFSGNPTTGANSGNAEVSLDIEMVVSMAPGLSKIIVYEGNPNNFIPNNALNRMATDNLAKQLSSSWGWSGGPNQTTDQILQQYAAQGQSYFQASGDDDAYTGAQALDAFSQTTTPMDNPFAISVGGTRLTTSSAGGGWFYETAWNRGNNVGTGGGVSTHYSIPSWQTNINMGASLGSTTMRNIPDVAMVAEDVFVKYGSGSSGTFGGTSCAAPLWAGFAALVNQQAALAGQPPIGFINPVLSLLARGSNYTASFHDIDTGDNIGTNTPGRYFAVTGFDLCTGWGSPTGTNLINALAPLLFVPVVGIKDYSLVVESSNPTNGAVDPGETVTLNVSLRNTGIVPTTNLVASLQRSGGVLAPSSSASYGVLNAFGGSATQAFSFTAAGSCGSAITATLQLQDGAASLGTVTFQLLLGAPVAGQSLAQNFDGVTTPALPAGWTNSIITGGSASWVTTTASKDTSPNAAFCADSTSSGVSALLAPVTPIFLTSAQVTFRHNYKFEKSGTINYDGGVLEIRIGNGSFIDILTAGGSFASGGYNGTLTSGSDNPLPGRQAWVGNSSTWKSVTVNLPAAAASQNVQLRWALATDSGNDSGSVTGWYVDSIALHDATVACYPVTADVAASLSLTPASVAAGNNLDYIIRVTNAGPQTASGVVVTDAIPVGVTFVSASPGCVYAAGTVVCQIGTLLAGAVSNLTLTVAPNAIGPFTNLVSVACVTPDGNPSNNIVRLSSIQTGGMPPEISLQPTQRVVPAGGVVSFQVSALGTPALRYQWFFNATNLLAGETASTLTLSNVQPAQAGDYVVLVTNLYGAATSSVASLTLAVAPSVTLQPSNLTVTAGSSAVFTVAALGTPALRYQWFFNATNLLAGETASTLTLSNVQPAQAGDYLVLVTNLYGTATSSVASLTLAVAPSITLQPSNLTVTGSSAVFTVAALGTPALRYQWFFNATNLLAGETASTLTLSNVQPTQAGDYLVLVTNLYGAATSSVASMVVVVAPSIILHPSSLTVTAGSNAVFTLAAAGTPPFDYHWLFNSTNAVPGAAGPTLVLSNAQPSQAGTYSVVVTNLAGMAMSDTAVLRVLVAPVVDVSSLLLTAGQASMSFQSVEGLTYTLEYSLSIAPAEWIPILPSVSGNGGVITLQDTNALPLLDTRFYRVRCE